jgi:ATP-binding cassette, subfamily A (ABC1), member 3
MTASAWDKFLLLSWKNWIIQLRHPIQTIFEVVVPVLVCSLLILIRSLTEVTDFPNEFRYPSQSVSNITRVLQIGGFEAQIAYSPKNPIINSLVFSVAQEYDLLPIGFDSALELEDYASTIKPFASIEFDDSYKVSRKNFLSHFKLLTIHTSGH